MAASAVTLAAPGALAQLELPQLELLAVWEMLQSAVSRESLGKSRADPGKRSKSDLRWRSNFRITSFDNSSLKITHSSFSG